MEFSAVNKRRRKKRFGLKESYNSEEWKSLFPISAMFGSTLLLSDPSNRPILGPLFFNPIPSTRHTLFSSSSLLPPFPPIHAAKTLPPIGLSDFDPSCDLPDNPNAATFAHNRLQTLRCPGPTNASLLFFPTGPNSDSVGFLLLSADLAVGSRHEGDVFSASCGSLGQRISRILVNPIAGGGRRHRSDTIIGYLMASAMYSVHWFVVVVAAKPGKVPSLVSLGGKVFKACSVAGACWSPHVPEESLVLLESGKLFLFDSEPWLRPDDKNPNRRGTRLRVSWDDRSPVSGGDVKWLSCEFSWHPRIVVVARSDAVFVVDLRPGRCVPTFLMKIETLRLFAPPETERFLALSKAGPDGFHFALASDSLLVLCDVRKPLIPVLQWFHDLPNPSSVNVFGLADLRSNDVYKASESGFCIVLGSFWDSEFKQFCYGQTSQGHCTWERPSKLSLSGDECLCGSCLVRQDILKGSVRPGVEWQRKKKIVLGFAVMRHKDLSPALSELGGFTLVRLMSSGELESQRYAASWETDKKTEESHGNCSRFNEYLMRHVSCDRDYKLGRKLTYLEFGFLGSYLERELDSKLGNRNDDEPRTDESLTQELHENLCEKLNVWRAGSGPKTAISVVFEEIKVPSSLHEVALTRMWANVRTGLLQMAFSCNPETMGAAVKSVGFLGVSEEPRLPPFLLRNPKSGHLSDALAGVPLPLPVLRSMGGFSFEKEYRRRTREAVETARRASSSSADHVVVSLSGDGDGDETPEASQTIRPGFALHKPLAFGSDSRSVIDKEEVFSTLVSKLADNKGRASVGLEMFDRLCPIQIEFVGDTQLHKNKLKFFRLFKKQYSKWQRKFDLYQDFCSNSLT